MKVRRFDRHEITNVAQGKLGEDGGSTTSEEITMRTEHSPQLSAKNILE